MTDTITCASCGANVPDGASFCTSCGNRVAPAPSGVPSEDTTIVDTAGLHDRTEVLPQTPAGPSAAAPPAQPTPPAWSPPPAAQPAWPPVPPVAPPVAPPGAWNQPPPPQPGWAQPQPPPPWASPGPPGTPGPWAPAPPPRRSAANRSWTLPAVLAFLGAILLVAGVFTPWFEGSGDAYPSRTGWELVSKKTAELSPFKSTPDPALLLGIAVVVIVVGGVLLSGTAPVIMRLLLAAAGVGTAVILIVDYLSIKDTVKDSFGTGTEFTYQYGFWVCIVAAVVMLLAAVMPSQARR